MLSISRPVSSSLTASKVLRGTLPAAAIVTFLALAIDRQHADRHRIDHAPVEIGELRMVAAAEDIEGNAQTKRAFTRYGPRGIVPGEFATGGPAGCPSPRIGRS